MEQVKKMLAALSERLAGLVKRNAVLAKPISVGDRHVLPLCELTMGVGGGGGTGEGKDSNKSKGPHKGTGGGVAGAAKAVPVAVIVIDGGKIRLESFGQ